MSAYEDEPTLLIAPVTPANRQTEKTQRTAALTSAHGAAREASPISTHTHTHTHTHSMLSQWLDDLTSTLEILSQPDRHPHPTIYLLAAAQPFLRGLPLIRSTQHCPDISRLHQQLVSALKQFGAFCQTVRLPQAHRITSRYLLCCTLDEAILSTTWGSKSQWANRSLLSLFHHENTGGEKVFRILDQLLERRHEHQDVLALYALCLAMGFEGKFRLMHDGETKRQQLKNALFTSVVALRVQPAHDHSANEGPNTAPSATVRLPRQRSLWSIALLTLLGLCIAYGGFNVRLNQLEAPLNQQIRRTLADIHRTTAPRQP